MSDENKREELKAKINEELDELSLEELEQVAGGGYSDALKNIAKGAWSIAKSNNEEK